MTKKKQNILFSFLGTFAISASIAAVAVACRPETGKGNQSKKPKTPEKPKNPQEPKGPKTPEKPNKPEDGKKTPETKPEDGKKTPEKGKDEKKPEAGKDKKPENPKKPEMPKEPEKKPSPNKPTPPTPTPVPPPTDKPQLSDDELLKKLTSSTIENKEISQNKVVVTLKLSEETHSALNAKNGALIKAKLTEKNKKPTETNKHEEEKTVQISDTKILEFTFTNLNPSTDYIITFTFGDGKNANFKKHEIKTAVPVVDIEKAREPKDAFLTTGNTIREFELSLDKDSKPSWITEAEKKQNVLANFVFEVELDDGKNTKQETSSQFPISVQSLYLADDKTLSLNGFFQIPSSAYDTKNNKEIPLKSYKVKKIEIRDQNNKNTTLETFNLTNEIISDPKLDFQPPKVKDVIKKDKKLYIEFDQSIEGLSFSEDFLFAENAAQIPLIPGQVFLPINNFEHKVVSRKDEKGPGRILEISFTNIDKKYTSVKLFKLLIKKQDRIYTHLFLPIRHNSGKDNDITINFKESSPSGTNTTNPKTSSPSSSTVTPSKPPVIASDDKDNVIINVPDSKKLTEFLKNYNFGN
ncbi:Vmc-like lipoprotein signal peptide domain-containing protein [Ureaplasma canigenitalium]|uniref:Vmc-like lipoprotein signal peptide domain-containing protein n=1 Tax=Ureaplasma canigenitalium TaxID=42092 RepID=UPI00068D9986|nr:hypothetical protein [Ureaplasma canigenitalium]